MIILFGRNDTGLRKVSPENEFGIAMKSPNKAIKGQSR
jgi:hypothetical protein